MEPKISGRCAHKRSARGSCRSRSRVTLDLFGRGNQRFSRQYLECRHVSAHANRKFRRAGAAPASLLEDVLHNAVLKRVVRDDADAPSRIEPAHRCLEAALENVELMVDLDAYRLEALARGVMPVSARRRGNPRFDGLDELSRGLDGAQLRRRTISRAILSANFSSPYTRRIRARSASL